MRLLFPVVLLLASVQALRADQFDYYTFPVLAKAANDGSLKEFKELTSEQLADYISVLPDSSSAFIVVLTNDKRYCKLLVQAARQKTGKDSFSPILLVEKYLTFKGTTDRAIQVNGTNLHIYPGLRASFDFGQIVPENVAGDLLVAPIDKDPAGFVLKPVKEAKLYVLTKAIAGVVPKKAPKLVVGEAFEQRFFNGRYKLYDDGRRFGDLKLEVNESGEITGTYTSGKDGREYEVTGKVGTPKHAVSFTIKFPATMQNFSGYMFTGNGKVIAGTAKMQERESAFYAERLDD